MSTRACVHFCENEDSKADAIIYRHSDGYPDGLGKDLQSFLKAVKKNVEDTRFDDAEYLAAKFVVWQAKRYMKFATGKKHYLNFISLGIANKDHGDIEYRYKVICNSVDGNLPKIIIEKV
jgi:hypothetical protein